MQQAFVTMMTIAEERKVLTFEVTFLRAWFAIIPDRLL